MNDEANKTADPDEGRQAESLNPPTSETDSTLHKQDAEPRKEPALTGMLIKDVAIIFAALSIWAAADTWHQTTGLWIAQIVSVGDAILVGLLFASLFHEWGHYAGAKAANAVTTRVSPKGFSLFRFKFDHQVNDHKQFHWMTYGGHIFHWGILLIMVIALPLTTLGPIALVSAIFGFIVYATVIEYNIVKDTWAGMDPEVRLQQLTGKDFQQATIVGGLAGLFALAGLA